jgi:hypothetical protein
MTSGPSAGVVSLSFSSLIERLHRVGLRTLGARRQPVASITQSTGETVKRRESSPLMEWSEIPGYCDPRSDAPQRQAVNAASQPAESSLMR